MKKNKGFTLIELLAVIIILAIIALIATPIIINVVEATKKEGFKQTALGYYTAAEYVYDEMFMNGKPETIQFTFKDGKQTSSNSNYQLETKGENPKEGFIYLSNTGNILVSIRNKKYCAMVDKNKNVTLTEDIENCSTTITQVPESCYSIKKEPFDSILAAWKQQEYNILYYDKESEACPKIFDTLILPTEVNNEKVEGVGTSSFQEMKMNRLIIGEGIQGIKSNAFSGNELVNIELPEGLIYIGGSAFKNNKLTNIAIPTTIQYLSGFSNNQLVSLEIPDGVTTIGDNAFKNNQLPDDQAFIYERNSDGTENKKKIIGYGGARRENVIIPEGVTEISNSVFSNIGLISVEIPNSVKKIGTDAFSHNQLTNVTIPNTVTSIGARAFNDNQLPDNQAFIYARNSNGTENKKKTIGYGGARRENVIIPEGVTEIGVATFNNVELIGVTIPDSVTTIATIAFRGSQLTNIVIPEKVKSIQALAFDDNRLTSITIPSSVTTIGTNAFSRNQFPNRAAITIEGTATRFDSKWASIGFPE